MRFSEPSCWYSERASFWASLLSPVAFAYGTLSARRMMKPAQYKSHLPVVCVGNFTVGGTGKTPTVATVVRLLEAQGHVPVILSRGYGGRVRKPTWVDACDDASAVGDEPAELGKAFAVLASPDRVAGAKVVESQAIGSLAHRGERATVIVMDDGLQNPWLAKSLVIAVVDGARGLGNGRCIPAGPMRAPLEAQLPCVQAIIFNMGSGHATAASAETLRKDFHGSLFTGRLVPKGDISWLKDRPVVAFAGIGVPERFFETLRTLGADVRETIAFPDHRTFVGADAARLIAAAAAHGAMLVTTDKDSARFNGINQAGPLADLQKRARALSVVLSFDARDEAQLSALLARHAPLRH